MIVTGGFFSPPSSTPPDGPDCAGGCSEVLDMLIFTVTAKIQRLATTNPIFLRTLHPSTLHLSDLPHCITPCLPLTPLNLLVSDFVILLQTHRNLIRKPSCPNVRLATPPEPVPWVSEHHNTPSLTHSPSHHPPLPTYLDPASSRIFSFDRSLVTAAPDQAT